MAKLTEGEWQSEIDRRDEIIATEQRLRAEMGEVITEAWQLIAQLERHWCIGFALYDGRPVARWCASAQDFVTRA